MSKVMDILDKVPVINIFGCLFAWSKGDEYTIDDDRIVLPQELAESDKQTDNAYDKHFKVPTNKGNGGKGKSKFVVEKEQLNLENTNDVTHTIENTNKEIEER